MKTRPLRLFVLTFLAILLAGSLWYVSPAGHSARLRRMDTQSLVAYTTQRPEDYDALYELAQRLERQYFVSEAIRTYLQAARLRPERGEAWLGAYRVAMQSGDGATAMQAAQEAVKSASDKASAWTALGNVYARGGQWEQALDAYLHATKSDAANAQAWDGLAQAALQRKKLTDAVNAAEQATRLDAKQGGYWLHLAKARRAAGDLPEARDAIQKAVQLDGQSADALTELGILLFQTAHTSDERRAAVTPLQSAADLLRGKPEAYAPCYQLGQVYLTEKKYAQAEQWLRLALQARPEDEAAQFALSRCLALQGKTQEAATLLTQFQQAAQYRLAVSQLQMRIGREPQRADLLSQLAELYAAHGAWNEAAATWKRCLEIAPNRADWQQHFAEAQRRASP